MDVVEKQTQKYGSSSPAATILQVYPDVGQGIKLLAAQNTCKKHHLAPLTFQGAKLVERIRVPTGPKGFELLGIVWKLHAREVTC